MSPAQHPFTLRLARELLEKAERSRGARNVRLRIDAESAPELFDRTHADEVQRFEALLQEFCEAPWVSLRLNKAQAFQTLADRAPILELVDFDALASWAEYSPRRDEWSRRFVRFLREQHAAPVAATGAAEPSLPWETLADYLARQPLPALEGLPFDAAVDILNRLQTLCSSAAPLPLRQTSCLVFSGRSKVLDHRQELLRLLGANAGQFYEAPVQLLVDVSERCEEILFVENLLTFEQMASHRAAAWENSALVFAAGFRGSARALRTPGGSHLYWRSGCEQRASRAVIESWQRGQLTLPIVFFGDLDYAGMEILRALRETCVDATAWKFGYGVLEQALTSGAGHCPVGTDKERQKDPGTTGCEYGDGVLLPAMRRTGRFVDQELFTVTRCAPVGPMYLASPPRRER